ncbi:DNA ligase D [Piscinibacter gummiphilus]|uniref:DNA ligase (ATP) n=1 Tax=Piscinibacter gummiphilus TaxID=946333 RepID=A0ABZ0CS17_9BURK|nr:DNA ligase D [Piscinibacter gummiphilus]WOB07658.1 DNA ligase D [Piscinibacter gummiphilus]
MGTGSLATYQRKRNFGATPEPAGEVMASGDELSFVIQKHAARRLHYDFRLELEGTLKSWAVPKGPSLDPHDKRMAVQVEDHPLSYGGFEGTIPEGHYGAGSVIVWDRGTWVPLGDPHKGYREGKLKFELRGEKLHGGFTLVRMKSRENERQVPWLLIKEHDDEARAASEFDVIEALPDSVLAGTKKRSVAAKAPAKSPAKARGAKRKAKAELPLSLTPQLATLVDDIPPGDDWLYEIKFDGYRIVTRIEGDDVRCFTRNGHDWSHRLPTLVKAIRALGIGWGWLDGEIVVAGPKGTPDFQLLQNAFDSQRTQDIQYYVFDLPFHDGEDLRERPLSERRERLQSLLAGHAAGTVQFSASFDADPRELLASARDAGLEGLIGKRASATYHSRRSTDWVKLKLGQRQEFVIGGFTDPKGSRMGIGALLLGVHDAEGKLRYAGNVGTGFDDKTLVALRKQLDAIEVTTSPYTDGPTRVGTVKLVKPHWVKPKLIAEVAFAEWTKSGHVRQAVFHGLRSDKPPERITQEVAKHMEKAPASKALPKDFRVTHPERVVDKSSGVTKGQLIEFYASVAELMLPHLKQRPVSLLRAPDGVEGQFFFQKHAEKKGFPNIEILDRALYPSHDPLLAIGTPLALLSAAQMNVIEFHTWNATTRAMDRPDRMVFDLDPGEGVGWPQVQEAAQLMHALLQEIGLVGFLKTSGGKGLHVVVPLAPKYDWDTVKDFSQAIVAHMASVIPDRFVAKSGPKNRVGRIFIDYLRNGLGATTVCAWSVRARPGLGVSVPVTWDELAGLTSGAHWTVQNVAERLATGNTPWDGYAKAKQSLVKPMKAMGFDPKAAR